MTAQYVAQVPHMPHVCLAEHAWHSLSPTTNTNQRQPQGKGSFELQVAPFALGNHMHLPDESISWQEKHNNCKCQFTSIHAHAPAFKAICRCALSDAHAVAANMPHVGIITSRLQTDDAILDQQIQIETRCFSLRWPSPVAAAEASACPAPALQLTAG